MHGEPGMIIKLLRPREQFHFFSLPISGTAGTSIHVWMAGVCVFFCFWVIFFWCVCMVLCEEMQFIFGHSEGDG